MLNKTGILLVALLFAILSLSGYAQKISTTSAHGDIEVYRKGKECLITILGRNHQNLPESIAFWSESMPHIMLVFANTTHVKNALDMLQHVELSRKNLQLSQSTLTLNNQHLSLAHIGGSGTITPIYLFGSEKELSADLTNNSFFIGNFTNHLNRLVHVKFNLQGFKEALRTSRAICQSRGEDTRLGSRMTFKAP